MKLEIEAAKVLAARERAQALVLIEENKVNRLIGWRVQNIRANIVKIVAKMNSTSDKGLTLSNNNYIVPKQFEWAIRREAKLSIVSISGLGTNNAAVVVEVGACPAIKTSMFGDPIPATKEQRVSVPVAWLKMSDRDVCKIVREVTRKEIRETRIRNSVNEIKNLEKEIVNAEENLRKAIESASNKTNSNVTWLKDARERAQKRHDALMSELNPAVS